MPCGCIDVCNCFLEDTDTISVTGSGTAVDPYLMTVIVDPDAGLFVGVDGVGILLDPDPDNQATLSAAGLFVACCSACVADSDTIDFEIDLGGCVTGEVILNPDGGLVSTPPNGIGIVIDPSSTAPVSVGPLGLRVDCCGAIEAPCPVDVQVFELDGEWVMPTGAEWVEVLLIGGGGAGGSGAAGNINTNRSSGQGGWAGGLTVKRFRASDLPATVDVFVGQGATGGAAVGPAASNGITGGTSEGTAFGGSGPPANGLPAGDELAFAYGGSGGPGGATNGSVAWTEPPQIYFTTEHAPQTAQNMGAYGSWPTPRSIQTPSATPQDTGLLPGAGGSGGGLNAANTEAAGVAGRRGDRAGEDNAGGTAGAVGGGDAGNGVDSTTLSGGGGGGGGGSSAVNTVDGGDGGDGGVYGAGGGGGGTVVAGGTAVSGAGGDGAPGIAIVVTHLCAEAGGAGGGGVPLGTGVDFWGEEADVPAGWVLAYGQLLDATTFTDWLALVGTTYGGDGIATVGVPDKRDRVSVGKGDMGGVDAARIGAILPATLGAVGGSPTLTTAQLPAHSHGVTDPGHRHSPSNNNGFVTGPESVNDTGTGSEFQGQSFASFTSTNGTGISIQNAGSGAEHLQPSIVCNYIIKVLP